MIAKAMNETEILVVYVNSFWSHHVSLVLGVERVKQSFLRVVGFEDEHAVWPHCAGRLHLVFLFLLLGFTPFRIFAVDCQKLKKASAWSNWNNPLNPQKRLVFGGDLLCQMDSRRSSRFFSYLIKFAELPEIVESSREDCMLGTSIITLELSGCVSWPCPTSVSPGFAGGDTFGAGGGSSCVWDVGSLLWLWISCGIGSPPSLWSHRLLVTVKTNQRTSQSVKNARQNTQIPGELASDRQVKLLFQWHHSCFTHWFSNLMACLQWRRNYTTCPIIIVFTQNLTSKFQKVWNFEFKTNITC